MQKSVRLTAVSGGEHFNEFCVGIIVNIIEKASRNI